jgi:hypothetical protein
LNHVIFKNPLLLVVVVVVVVVVEAAPADVDKEVFWLALEDDDDVTMMSTRYVDNGN